MIEVVLISRVHGEAGGAAELLMLLVVLLLFTLLYKEILNFGLGQSTRHILGQLFQNFVQVETLNQVQYGLWTLNLNWLPAPLNGPFRFILQIKH